MCYICECGREFKTKNSLKSHYRFCKVHKPQKKYDANGKCISKSKYKVDENLYRCECGIEFNCFQGLNGHFSQAKRKITCAQLLLSCNLFNILAPVAQSEEHDSSKVTVRRSNRLGGTRFRDS